MSTRTRQHSYTIKEAAALTGLPARTLRYSESIGVIAPVSRGASSGHRVHDDMAAQERRLALEVEQVALGRRYVQIKIDYWHAVEAGDTERADLPSTEARSLADELKRVRTQ